MSTLTKPSIFSLACYEELCNEGTYYRQSYGEGLALGFHGSDEFITKAHNLFSNYDFRPLDQRGDYPTAPQLIWVWPKLAYIYTTEARLLESLKCYFYVRIAQELGSCDVKTPIGDNPIVEDLIIGETDEEMATRFCAQYDSFHTELMATEADSIEDVEYTVDEDLCSQLALQCAQSFIANQITPRSFMPKPSQLILAEHSLGRAEIPAGSSFESLIDGAIKS